jgi:hypothetical protein
VEISCRNVKAKKKCSPLISGRVNTCDDHDTSSSLNSFFYFFKSLSSC